MIRGRKQRRGRRHKDRNVCSAIAAEKRKKKNSLQSAEMPTEFFLFCFGALEAGQKRDVVKSSAATACLFHTKHNSGCIFIGKLGPTHGDVRTGAAAASRTSLPKVIPSEQKKRGEKAAPVLSRPLFLRFSSAAPQPCREFRGWFFYYYFFAFHAGPRRIVLCQHKGLFCALHNGSPPGINSLSCLSPR